MFKTTNAVPRITEYSNAHCHCAIVFLHSKRIGQGNAKVDFAECRINAPDANAAQIICKVAALVKQSWFALVAYGGRFREKHRSNERNTRWISHLHSLNKFWAANDALALTEPILAAHWSMLVFVHHNGWEAGNGWPADGGAPSTESLLAFLALNAYMQQDSGCLGRTPAWELPSLHFRTRGCTLVTNIHNKTENGSIHWK
jgi:hypothetical protein